MTARIAITLSVAIFTLPCALQAQNAASAWNQRLQPPSSPNNFAASGAYAARAAGPVAPSAALKPLGAPSVVDQYKPRVANYAYGAPLSRQASAAASYPVRQTAYQIATDQNFVVQPQLGVGAGGGFQTPGLQPAPGAAGGAVIANPQTAPLVNPNITANPNYPANPAAVGTQQPIAPNVAPLAPAPTPIATVGTSPCVTPASGWMAGGAWDCGPLVQTSAVSVAPSAYTPPQQYSPNVVMPNRNPYLYSPNNSGYVPLFSLGSPYPNVQVGQGIIGQPTVYVPGQPVRNFFRYLSP